MTPSSKDHVLKTLKPCPFCGAYPDVGIYPESEDSPRGYFCKCPACLAETSMSSDRATAIAAWNRRADPLVEELRGALERLLSAAKLLQANSEGCAVNHYGEDFGLYGVPGFLIDTAKDIEAASEALALPVGNISARDLAQSGPEPLTVPEPAANADGLKAAYDQHLRAMNERVIPAIQADLEQQRVTANTLRYPSASPEPAANADKFSCAAKSNPEDCQWPFCGCDPAADRVLESISEHYMVIVSLGDPKLKADIYQILVETCRGELQGATAAILDRIAEGRSRPALSSEVQPVGSERSDEGKEGASAVDAREDDPTREGIFRSHNCWKCEHGAKPCVQGGWNRCDNPRARND